MKKSIPLFICVIYIVFLLSGCNSKQKEELQSVIDLEIGEETIYTTASYNNYLSALEKANTVMDHDFSTVESIDDAKETLHSAIDNLKVATKGIYRIEYEFSMLSNHSVGNSWDNTVVYNGRNIDSGDTITAELNSEITLQGIVTETDSIPDTAACHFTLQLKDGMVGVAQITVRENRGRYIGNTAIWNLKCTVTLIRRL